MTREKKWHLLIGLPLLATLLAPLLAWGYIGSFTRYWYDDFSYTATLHRLGFFSSQAYWYQNWIGRYTFVFANTVLEYLGPWTAPILPAVLLLAWLAVGIWLFNQVLSLLKLPYALIASCLLAELVIYTTLNSAPDIVASFYWQTGTLVYSVPLVFLTLQVGILIKGARQAPSVRISSPIVIASGLVAFVAGGCTEVCGVVQVVALSFLIVFSLILGSGPLKRAIMLIALAGLVGSLISLSILVLSPGNALRAGTFPPHPQPLELIKLSFYYPLTFVERHVRRNAGTACLSLVFPLWLAFMLSLRKSGPLNASLTTAANRKRVAQLLVVSPVALYLVLVASFVPGYYVLSDALPPRSQIIPKFALIVFTVFWIFIASLVVFERFKESAKIRNLLLVTSSLLVLILVAISPPASARHTFALRFKARDYAMQWDILDQRIRLLRSQGTRDLVLPTINASEWQLGFGRSDLLPTPDPTNPRNRALADYYDLDSITFK